MFSARKVIAVFLVYLASTCTAAAGRPWWAPPDIPTAGPIILTDSKWTNGGRIELYESMIDGAIARGQNVIVDDYVFSAGTMWLKMPPGRICATARGWFGFHRATYSATGMPSAPHTRRMMATYPEKVKAIIAREGGLTEKLIRIRAADVLPLCK
jgi:hypothetical protein